MTRTRRTFLAAMAGWSPSVWACSGPGAEDEIATSALTALAVLVLALVCSVTTFVVPKLRPRGALGVFFWAGLPLVNGLFAFTLGISRGDCGFALRYVSLCLGGVVAVAMVASVVRRRQ